MIQKIFERVKALIFNPRETWTTIAGEETTIPGLIKSYLSVLAGIPAVAQFLGNWILGVPIPFVGTYHFSFRASLFYALIWFVVTLAGIWLLGMVISYTAAHFGSSRNDHKGFQVAAYACTPYLMAGALLLIPSLNPLVTIVGLFGLYLLFIGLPIVMEVPQEKALAYTVLVIAAVIVIMIIVGSFTQVIFNAFGPDLPRI